MIGAKGGTMKFGFDSLRDAPLEEDLLVSSDFVDHVDSKRFDIVFHEDLLHQDPEEWFLDSDF